MPSIVALYITLIFIAFLLRLDKKQNPTASFFLWIPTLWMLLTSSKGIDFWILGIERTGFRSIDKGSILNVVFIGVLFLIGFIILIKRRFNFSNSIKNNRWFIILIGFMLLSIIWSDMVFISFKRWFRFALVPLVMAFVVATEVNPLNALESIFRRIIYIQIPLSILLIKYYPYLGVQFSRWTDERMWIGISTQKNGLALRCVFAIFYLLWIRFRRFRKRETTVTWYQGYVELFILILSIYLFMGPQHTLTYSSTSLATLLIGLSSLISLLWLRRYNIVPGLNSLLFIIAFIIVFGSTVPFIGGLGYFDITTLLGRESNLTGRDEIWQLLMPAVKHNFLLGHGFGGFWTDKWVEIVRVNTAHNGYLDTILSTGIIGLILSSIYLILSCRKANFKIKQNSEWGIFLFCIVLMFVVHNIAETSLSSIRGFFPIIIFLDVIIAPKVSK